MIAILGWIAGLIFVFMGLVGLTQDVAPALCAIMIGLLLMPAVINYLQLKLNKKIPNTIRALLVFVFFVLMGLTASTPEKDNLKEGTDNPKNGSTNISNQSATTSTKQKNIQPTNEKQSIEVARQSNTALSDTEAKKLAYDFCYALQASSLLLDQLGFGMRMGTRDQVEKQLGINNITAPTSPFKQECLAAFDKAFEDEKKGVLLEKAWRKYGCFGTETPRLIQNTTTGTLCIYDPNIPNDVTFKIIEDYTKRDIKRVVDVILNRRVDDETLQNLAYAIKNTDHRNYERVFIRYYINEKSPHGAWAATNFVPELEVARYGDWEGEEGLKQNEKSNAKNNKPKIKTMEEMMQEIEDRRKKGSNL